MYCHSHNLDKFNSKTRSKAFMLQIYVKICKPENLISKINCQRKTQQLKQ